MKNLISLLFTITLIACGGGGSSFVPSNTSGNPKPFSSLDIAVNDSTVGNGSSTIRLLTLLSAAPGQQSTTRQPMLRQTSQPTKIPFKSVAAFEKNAKSPPALKAS